MYIIITTFLRCKSWSQINTILPMLILQFPLSVRARRQTNLWINLQSWTKSVENFHFLNHRMPIPRIWYCYDTPPLTPPWSKFFSRDQKRSSRTSTLFLWGQGGVFVVASAFKSFILKLDMVMSQRFCLRLYM